jgi:hypothetical protein
VENNGNTPTASIHDPVDDIATVADIRHTVSLSFTGAGE